MRLCDFMLITTNEFISEFSDYLRIEITAVPSPVSVAVVMPLSRSLYMCSFAAAQ